MSDDARPPRAILDTDVIYSRVLHELIGRLAYQERLLTLIWSEELLNEAKDLSRLGGGEGREVGLLERDEAA